ncbi:hypothetical protein P43SY_009741 [Pythium insidiosum]|uniref:Solanesyl diphosphate synthase n=1 Tax=Pythium insidiosum TaxID=114742 RepID=A0AAD5Q4C4_PYTIN|nr:hypothetical protein P43SY_009741 [Pythium insidiosum]
MKLLLTSPLRHARALRAAHQRSAAMSSLRDSAVRAVAGRLRADLETNPNLWLSASAVDEPTVSILDPAPGYAHEHSDHQHHHHLATDFTSSSPIHDGLIEYLHTDPRQLPDPFSLVAQDMVSITSSIKHILGSDHPVLSAVARYFFEHDGGKKVRPTMVLLVSMAAEEHRRALGLPLPTAQSEGFTVAAQQRLAEITEMIHTASLLHDDVIDEADTRRGVPSVNKVFGDKLSILAGDFLLARSSICLARLRSLEAIELMSTAIEHLVKGEVMQMKHADSQSISAFEYYLRKNYYKTGSLMANSCRAALELGKHEDIVCDLGFAYGRHIGLAFQLVDDVLDYEGTQSGKPLLADLKSGLATAPLLLAQQEFPVLKELAARKFSKDGDIELASELVEKSTGIARSKALAIGQAELACQAVMQLAPSPARDALREDKVTNRAVLFDLSISAVELPTAELAAVPWASRPWPSHLDGINYRWRSPKELSPAEKYAKAFGLDVEPFLDRLSLVSGVDSSPSGVKCKTQADCRQGHVCARRRGAGTTTGTCHVPTSALQDAWALAAVTLQSPRCAVEKNGVTFHPEDIKALLAQARLPTLVKFVNHSAYFPIFSYRVQEFDWIMNIEDADIDPDLAKMSDHVRRCQADTAFDFESPAPMTDEQLMVACRHRDCISVMDAIRRIGFRDCTFGSASGFDVVAEVKQFYTQCISYRYMPRGITQWESKTLR